MKKSTLYNIYVFCLFVLGAAVLYSWKYDKVLYARKLHVGDLAPDFEAKDQDGKDIRLKDFLGRKVVLYFYPQDNTPFCTLQARNLRNNYKALHAAGYTIFGISSDSAMSHRAFIDKYKLPFSLLVDTEHLLQEKYGAWVQHTMFWKKYCKTDRITFVIDEKGTISKIIDAVKVYNHALQILS